VPITRRYRRRRRHAALMLTVGKGHSLNRNISGKMNHSTDDEKADEAARRGELCYSRARRHHNHSDYHSQLEPYKA